MFVPRKKLSNYPLLPATCSHAVLLACVTGDVVSVQDQSFTQKKKGSVQDCLSHHPRVFA